VVSVTTSPAAVATFPACNASSKGMLRFGTDTSAYYFCNGTLWAAVASGGGGVTSVTATAPIVSSGGATPNITCIDASGAVGGCLTAGNQTIGGAKTFGAGVTAPSFTATAAAAANGLVVTSGAYICLDGVPCTKRVFYNGSNLESVVPFEISGFVVGGGSINQNNNSPVTLQSTFTGYDATTAAWTFSALNAPAASGALLVDAKDSAGTEVLKLNTEGDVTATYLSAVGAYGPNFVSWRGAAAATQLGSMQFDGVSDTSVRRTAARVEAEWDTNANAHEYGKLAFELIADGVVTQVTKMFVAGSDNTLVHTYATPAGATFGAAAWVADANYSATQRLFCWGDNSGDLGGCLLGAGGIKMEAEVTATTYLRSIGVATGSLPTCDTTIKGAIETDTTLNCAKFCNGSAWSGCLKGTDDQVTMGATSFDTAAPETANFTGGGTFSSDAAPYHVTCSWHVAPIGDGTQHVEVQLWDVVGTSELCTCQLSSCNPADTSAAGGSVDLPRDCACTGTAQTALKPVTVRFKNTTSCTTNPGQVVCTGSFTIAN